MDLLVYLTEVKRRNMSIVTPGAECSDSFLGRAFAELGGEVGRMFASEEAAFMQTVKAKVLWMRLLNIRYLVSFCVQMANTPLAPHMYSSLMTEDFVQIPCCVLR